MQKKGWEAQGGGESDTELPQSILCDVWAGKSYS